jgi:branched-subunit amino acid aminotransferase/4-amino-4-deoxychorismate lyase
MEIAPVRRIDGARVGDAVPGPVTALLMAAYRDRASWAAV